MRYLEEEAGMKIAILAILLIVLLAACVPTDKDYLSTVTVEEATAGAMRANAFQTQTAEPSSTPQKPVSTIKPDSRSPIEKCAQLGFGIRYVISGTGVNAVSLTWKNDTNGTEQGDYEVPFCKIYTGFKSGDFLYLSAQIIEPTSGAGTITCSIYNGHDVVAMANASGFPSIASCDGSAK